MVSFIPGSAAVPFLGQIAYMLSGLLSKRDYNFALKGLSFSWVIVMKCLSFQETIV